MTTQPLTLARRLKRLRARSIETGFAAFAAVHERLPVMQKFLKRLDIHKDVAYGALPSQKLDIYRPASPAKGDLGWPVVLYVHGGAFSLCSKDTHRNLAAVHAAQGFLTFNIDYRLAPKHPFPAGLEDACTALAWVFQHAASYGGDPANIVIAGESAGGNLVLAATACTVLTRPEPWAKAVYGLPLKAVMSIMPCLQVSDPDHRGVSSPLVRGVLHDMARAYLGKNTQASADNLLADPIRWLEQARPEAFPAVWSGVGTADLCAHDTRRLQTLCTQQGWHGQFDYYPDEGHAFHLLWWKANSKQYWRDCFSFLKTVSS
jgi:acetyl esterase